MVRLVSVQATSLDCVPFFPTGRLGVMALLGAWAETIPFPWLPTSALRLIRGALVQDVVSRHGLTLTTEARQELAEPSEPEQTTQVKKAAGFLVSRLLSRFGPLNWMAPAWAGAKTFALGHMLDRYLEQCRRNGSVRIQLPEAQRIRQVMERAWAGFVQRSLPVDGERHTDEAPGEDLRPFWLQASDGLILGVASIPAYLVRRLEASFDKAAAQIPE